MAYNETGRCLEPIRLEQRKFLGRVKLPNGKTVNVYRANQKNSMNEWMFYYYRGRRYLITEHDWCDSQGVV